MKPRRLSAYSLIVIALGAIVLVSAEDTQVADRFGPMVLSAAAPAPAAAVCPTTCGVCQTMCHDPLAQHQDCISVCGEGWTPCGQCFDLDPEEHTCNGGEPPPGYNIGWWCGTLN